MHAEERQREKGRVGIPNRLQAQHRKNVGLNLTTVKS